MARNYLITAGPTHEPIDEVRYLANRSSGAMGLALAAAAREAGHQVALLLGPVGVEPPDGITTYHFESTADLSALLDQHFPACHVLIMAAAVADYRPLGIQTGKIERCSGHLTLKLESTPDLVAGCAARRQPGQYIMGFALAEAARLTEAALGKLQRKGLDAIVANPLATMGAAGVNATVYTTDGRAHIPTVEPGTSSTPPAASPGHPPLMPKADFARWLVNFIDERC
jgi:phosphopantothenoylcysteine decarboxylase/phosphopantothenate--cysteine ligase